MKNPTKIKICGITNQKDLQTATSMRADYVGFVTGVTSSPRNLSLDEATRLVQVVSNAKTVLVMVPRDTNEIINAFERVMPDIVQVHGDFDLYKDLEDLEIPIVIGLNDEIGVEKIVDLSHKFTILLDTHVSGMYGGTGVTHDWGKSRLIREKISPAKLVLAGGLTPKNVVEAVKIVDPYCVDVSSGVETGPGVKDHERISAFIKAVRELKSVE